MLDRSVKANAARQTIRVYEAAAAVPGPHGALAMAFRDVLWSRHVIWHLFVRDFRAAFRQRLLGYLWALLAPLLGVVSFVFMHWTGILVPGSVDVPYPLYVYMGTSIWGLLIGVLTTVASGLVGNADLIMRTNIPRIGLALTGMANVLYGVIVNICVLLVLMATYGIAPSVWALAYPLALLPILLLGMGIGLFLAVIGAIARDVTTIFTALLNLLMYVTPVLYPVRFAQPLLVTVTQWNPLTYLVDTPRALFIAGNVPNLPGFAIASAFSVASFLFGLYTFYLIKDKVSERL